MVAEAADGDRGLTPKQAHDVAYRVLARYYDYERIAPILRVLEAISWTSDLPEGKAWAMWELWRVALEETLDGAPLPELPPPWEA